MTKHLTYILIFIFVFQGIVIAQKNDKQNSKLRKQADIALEKLDYLNAFNLYSLIISNDTSDRDAYYKAGLCLFNINKTDTTAITYFKHSLDVPESHFYLGRIYHLKGDEKKALEEFFYFKNINKEISIEKATVEQWIRKCEMGMEAKINEQNFIIRNIGGRINSKYADYVPLVTHDRQHLIFTSRRQGQDTIKDPYGNYYEDIYISTKENNAWGDPKNAGAPLNSPTHDACVAISPAGELVLYRTDARLTGGDLFTSKLGENGWSTLEKLSLEINSEYQEASLCYSPGTNEVYFSSNRPGGYGGKDLYKITLFMNGQASHPQNLGPGINTAEDEDAPFVDIDAKALYFSSKGHNTIGEYDIFKCEFDEDKKEWMAPENMGAPINSPADDIFFFEVDDATEGYFSSNRAGGFGSMDIYQIRFTESKYKIVKGFLKFPDADIKESTLEQIKLTVYDDETGKLAGIYRPNKHYKTFIMFLEKNKSYKIVTEGAHIEPHISYMTLNEDQNEFVVDLKEKK